MKYQGKPNERAYILYNQTMKWIDKNQPIVESHQVIDQMSKI